MGERGTRPGGPPGNANPAADVGDRRGKGGGKTKPCSMCPGTDCRGAKAGPANIDNDASDVKVGGIEMDGGIDGQ
eukprot:m.133606 g.133606  ORF g.133606 m.133606 type:complete len:75 (+) comp38128_c0_seq23:183-407(+)